MKKEVCLSSLKDNVLTMATFAGVLIGKFAQLFLFHHNELLLRHRTGRGTEELQGGALEPQGGHVRQVHWRAVPQHAQVRHHPLGGALPHRFYR